MSSSPRVSSRLSILALLLTLGAPAPILAQGWPRPNGPVRALAVQADGKILVGGDFTMLDPAVTVFDGTGTRFGRLFPDGTLDRAFANTWADQPVETIALQPDGKILVGGSFTILCGSLRNHLARLNADGTLDAGFTAGAD